jgi:hypothetical protein
MEKGRQLAHKSLIEPFSELLRSTHVEPPANEKQHIHEVPIAVDDAAFLIDVVKGMVSALVMMFVA